MLKKLLFCTLTDLPGPAGKITTGRIGGDGDNYDEWSYCRYCRKKIHRDTHYTSDGKWRHYRPIGRTP